MTPRTARAVLGWLFEPGSHTLAELLTDPIDAADRLAAGVVDLTDVRAELRRHDPAGLYRSARAAATAFQRTGRILIPEDPIWPGDLPTDGSVTLACLWARGPADPPTGAVSVTGARACTAYGIHVAAELAAGLTEHGRTVLNAAGYGIDAAALRATLTAGTTTPVVLQPCGLDRPHPAGNSNLLDHVAARGLLLSAWAPDAEATRARHHDNRALLAAMTAGTVVVETHQRGSSQYQASLAADLGRAAMAIPGPVTSAMSAGCHQLLRTDTRIHLVTGTADVLTHLDAQPEGGLR